jgi:hypothetical protein
MSETYEIIIGIVIMIAVIALTRTYHAWKSRRAWVYIIEDLKAKSAFTPESAVELPYAKRNVLRIGIRDHRPSAMDQLVINNIVGRCDDGRYYLKARRA